MCTEYKKVPLLADSETRLEQPEHSSQFLLLKIPSLSGKVLGSFQMRLWTSVFDWLLGWFSAF